MLVSVQPNFQKLLETIEINKQKRHFLNFSNEKAYVYTHMYFLIESISNSPFRNILVDHLPQTVREL